MTTSTKYSQFSGFSQMNGLDPYVMSHGLELQVYSAI